MRIESLGDLTQQQMDAIAAGASLDSSGMVFETSTPVIETGDVPCMPAGAVGPLQPGQVYCGTNSLTPPVTSLQTSASTTPDTTPAGSGASGLLVVLAAALVLFVAVKK